MKSILPARVIAAVAAVFLSAPPHAHAANKCIACQNACFAKIKRCERSQPAADCFHLYGAAYGECKIACKGSPICFR